MIPGTSDKPPGFNWTEEEKAFLRRTLRVKELTEERIEVETYEFGLVADLNTTGYFLGSAIAAAGLVAYFGTSVTPQGLEILLMPFLAVAVPILVCVLCAFAGGSSDFGTHGSFFPDSPWFVHHHPVQSRLVMLRRTNSHRRKLLSKWVLEHPAPSEAEQRVLVDGLRGYLHSADRLPLMPKRKEEG